jgi:hypothetical protein
VIGKSSGNLKGHMHIKRINKICHVTCRLSDTGEEEETG